ncbi:MAG: SDR family NAD(P)-dependent oxidoreductase [Alphaproteobacteria bacterium]|nr:SDR family NAD(P)-dependent oxidoreductase [Alphaproteobacteria bacterium]
MNINNKIAVITGAGSGLGEACTIFLAAKNAKIALLDYDLSKAENVAKKLNTKNVLALQCDVSKAESAENAINQIKTQLGTPSILINCAGVATPTKIISKDGPLPLQFFENVINVNLVGTFNMMRLCTHLMSQEKPDDNGETGIIINTSSIAAFEGQMGQAAYAASKGGVASLTLPAARELARFGIRVMAIAPGLFGTPMLLSMPDIVQESLKSTLLFPKRFGLPEEFAQLVGAIIENPMLNGEVIRLDGGLRMQAK